MFSNRAYILIKTKPEETRETRLALEKQRVIEGVEVITGPYDIIATIEAPTADDVLDYVVDKIRYTKGVMETTTCFVVQTES